MKKPKKQRTTRNKFEKKIEKQLKQLCCAHSKSAKRSKLSFKYESEKIPYVIAGHYIPDFIVVTPMGKVYLETKGHFRPEAKRKMAAVRRQHPELDIRIVFYSRKAKDIRWAEKHGFKWAIEEIPEDW